MYYAFVNKSHNRVPRNLGFVPLVSDTYLRRLCLLVMTGVFVELPYFFSPQQ